MNTRLDGQLMADQRQISSSLNNKTEITLGLLNAVEENSRLTQRTIAKELGIALGLTNAYLKRCIRKGYIKVSQAPANRYAYYLTPKGFAEKSRLTADFLSISFNFFRHARTQCADVFAQCEVRGWRRVVFCGDSDLVEIAVLCADKFPVEPIAVIGLSSEGGLRAGLPVLGELADAGPIDAAIVTDLSAPQATFDNLIQRMPAERVLTPRFFNVSRHQPTLME